MQRIEPLAALNATVRVPGSKSYTQRAMVIAALAKGESRLENALLSQDTGHLAAALQALGAGIRIAGDGMAVTGTDGRVAVPPGPLFLGNNGTAMRLLTGVAALADGPVTLTGDPRLRERPLQPLLAALATLGAGARTEGGRGYPPVTLEGGGITGGEAILGNIGSSQFVSSLLIAAPYARRDVELLLEGEIPSRPYLDLTIAAMGAFGVEAAVRGNRFSVRAGQRYAGRAWPIEGDASSASYFFAAAALTGGRVRVENMVRETRQGDIGLLAILAQLGCAVRWGGDGVEVKGGELPGGELAFDMGAMPDMVPTLAILAARRPGRTVIHNVAHLRIKESDRLAALAAELGKTGIAVTERADGLEIAGGRPRGAVIATYNDHRIAMAFAILGLVSPGMAIENEACVGKSFPGFWQALAGLYR